MTQLAPLSQSRGLAYTGAQLALIKNTVAKDCNTDEFNLFIEICKQQGLDPFRKQIYGMVTNKDKPAKRQLVVVTGIDGYRAKAARCGDYRPADTEPEFDQDDALVDYAGNPAGLIKATVTVYKFGPDKQWHSVIGVARWSEFAPLEEDFDLVDTGEKWPDGNPKKSKVPKPGAQRRLAASKAQWSTSPYNQLAKCAEAQALRRGWPEEVGGLYVREELDRTEVEQTASEQAEQHAADERMKRIAGPASVPIMLNFTDGLQMIPAGQFADKVLAHLRPFESASEIEGWKEMNRIGLQQFWAMQPHDALTLKKEIEAMEAAKQPAAAGVK